MKTNTQIIGRIGLFFTAGILIMMLNTSCNNIQPWPEYLTVETGFNHIPPDSSQQIIVWKKPNTNDSYLNKWLDSIKSHCGPIKIAVFCEDCDSSLLLLTGAGIKTFIQGTGTTKGGGSTCSGSGCPPAGDGDTIYWCVNFPVDIDKTDSVYNQDAGSMGVLSPDTFENPAITVAVFDTGIEPGELSKYLYQGSLPVCLAPNAVNGWNFPKQNNNITDDYNKPKGHGAIVARIIAEQVNHYKLNGVKILPVKIHDSSGQSDLFSVLCGFAYAKERGAKIINASFGFYAPKQPMTPGTTVLSEDPNALLMKKYIQYYLTNNHILLVAAAGNKNDPLEKAVFTNVGLTPPADLRNLDNVYFYPASLAGDPDLPNVIAVTTVSTRTKKVSPNQNYSKNVVDIGVNAESINGDHYYFRNPRVNRGFSEGSSFATPIVTGILCAHYNLIMENISPNSFNKDLILGFLLRQNLNIGILTTFGDTIKTGVMVNNVTP